jgi:hypothetical protein
LFPAVDWLSEEIPQDVGAVAETRNGIIHHRPHDREESASLRLYGEWLQPQLELLAQLLQKDACVLQLNPGIGTHAVFLGSLLQSAGHLILYEPRLALRRILIQNLTANRITTATLLHQLDDNGVRLAVDDLQLERLDLIKVDGDLDTLELLQGADQTLWQRRPRLFVRTTDSQETLAAAIKSYGYRCWRHETALFSPTNYNRSDRNIFNGRIACAIVAIPEETEVSGTMDGCVEI